MKRRCKHCGESSMRWHFCTTCRRHEFDRCQAPGCNKPPASDRAEHCSDRCKVEHHRSKKPMGRQDVVRYIGGQKSESELRRLLRAAFAIFYGDRGKRQGRYRQRWKA